MRDIASAKEGPVALQVRSVAAEDTRRLQAVGEVPRAAGDKCPLNIKVRRNRVPDKELLVTRFPRDIRFLQVIARMFLDENWKNCRSLRFRRQEGPLFDMLPGAALFLMGVALPARAARAP